MAGDDSAASRLLLDPIRQLEGFIERIAHIHPEYVGQ